MRSATCSAQRSGSVKSRIERAWASLHARSTRIPVGSPARSSHDLARDRIGRVPADAQGIESGRAHDTLVQRVVGHDDRSVDTRSVEVVDASMPAPTPMRSTPWQRTHVVSGQAAAWARIAATSTSRSPTPRTSCQWGCRRGDREMVVGVDQARHEDCAGEVHDLGVGCVRTRQQVAAADGDDPVAVDEHDLGTRHGAVHREDGPAGERAHDAVRPQPSSASSRLKARRSSTNCAGRSKAPKWPPRSISVQCTTS